MLWKLITTYTYGNLFFVKSERTKEQIILFDIYVIEHNARDPVKIAGEEV